MFRAVVQLKTIVQQNRIVNFRCPALDLQLTDDHLCG